MLNRISLITFATGALAFGQMTGVQQPPGSLRSTPVAAQSPNAATASPGTINYVEGQVSVDNQPLRVGQAGALQPGQTLSTGNGFAEVLLTPGAFLRVGHNSEVRLNNFGLADARAELNRGTALVEVDQMIQGTNLVVAMNGDTVQVEKKGLYDLNADQHTVAVLDGKVNVVEPSGSKSIGKGDELQLASERPLKSMSFSTKEVKTEPLYVWSEARSQDESRANVAVAQNVFAYGGWAGPGWYWSPYASFYSYLPGDGFLYSPFGWGFYSPRYIGFYGAPYGYSGRYGVLRGARVSGVNTHINSFAGGAGFHATGGFHGGGGRR
jgi:hypothetical protein